MIDLADLSEFDPEEIAVALDGLPDHVVEALMGGSTGDMMPVADDPVGEAQAIDNAYRSRPHLDYLASRLANAVADVEAGQDRKLTVSMPPRMGKSHLSSIFMPVWLLHKHPDWKIGLISHSPSLATSWGRSVRRIIEEHGAALGIALAPDAGAVNDWQTTAGGGILSRSAPGQSLTGYGFDVLLIDDPVKNFATAHSETKRTALWEWWTGDAFTRLEPPSMTIVVGCLTADAPVLMADGSEKRIEHVRPGDRVVTYEDGRFVESVVNNWANQGPDHVYAIRMGSGRVVHANAKHPFLTLKDGAEVWQRTDALAPGDMIVAAGENGKAWSAQSTDALDQSVLKDYASLTTISNGGQTGTDETRQTRHAEHICDIDTAWNRSNTINCSERKTDDAQYADAHQTNKTPEVGVCCSLTTATTGVRCEDCCATTATSSSDTVQPWNDWKAQWSTCGPTSDVVQSVLITGHEDVFDIEVDRTHNFVVNGLVTHNTRWHEDDMIGRLLSHDHEGNPDDWEVISFSALAEADDVLGRTPGDPLMSPLLDESPDDALVRWQSIRESVGEYAWAALYMQRPAPSKGAIFLTDNFRYWTRDPDLLEEDDSVVLMDPATMKHARWIDSWDATFKATDSSDYVVGQRWAISGQDRYLIDQSRARRSFTETITELESWETQTRLGSPQVFEKLIEDKANGPAIIDTLKQTVKGIKPITPVDSKEARARAVTPELEAGHLILPHPDERGNEWVRDLVLECRSFPNGAHDDQCLVAGTMVTTPSGRKPIESIRAGDSVLGYSGWVTVQDAGQTGSERTVRAAGLEGTPNHPVWTEKGWRNLSQLAYDDVLWIHAQSKDAHDLSSSNNAAGACPATNDGGNNQSRDQQTRHRHDSNGRQPIAETAARALVGEQPPECVIPAGSDEKTFRSKKSPSTGSHFADTPTHREGHTGTISNPHRHGRTGESNLSTGKSTSVKSDRSQTDTMSIIGTATPRTTTRLTWWRSLRLNIWKSPAVAGQSADRAGTTVRQCWRTLKAFAGRLRSGTGLTRAELGIENTPTALSPHRVPVFNLTTSDGTFFANGVLTHNCDALTQVLNYVRSSGSASISVPGRGRTGGLAGASVPKRGSVNSRRTGR